MDVFERFIPVAADTSTSWEYFQLEQAESINGPTGLYFQLICQSQDGGSELHATCDNRYREHLRPYLELLVKSREGVSTEAPCVPLFLGKDGRWRFSWIGAEKDYPELRDRNRPTSPPERDGATRLQVSVSHDLANRFKAAAFERGMTHTDLLLRLVRDSVT